MRKGAAEAIALQQNIWVYAEQYMGLRRRDQKTLWG